MIAQEPILNFLSVVVGCGAGLALVGVERCSRLAVTLRFPVAFIAAAATCAMLTYALGMTRSLAAVPVALGVCMVIIAAKTIERCRNGK